MSWSTDSRRRSHRAVNVFIKYTYNDTTHITQPLRSVHSSAAADISRSDLSARYPYMGQNEAILAHSGPVGTLGTGFSGLVCKNVHSSGASGAHDPGGQQVSDTVARIAELSARSRDFSMMSPNGARRRCPTAGCQTQNGRSDDEYDSIPLYGSRNTSCTRPPVSLSSPRDLSRSSRSMTRSHAPTAVGTSPTGLSGAPRRVRVRARRRAVGPTRRLCFVYI